MRHAGHTTLRALGRFAAVIACLVCVAGCGRGSRSTAGTPSAIDAQALAPSSIEVHPLTRIAAVRNGTRSLVLHLEVRDSFGHAIKALGRTRVELYRPVEGAGTGSGSVVIVPSQQNVWTVDLTDPNANAVAWDGMITRTYTLSLGELPEWLLAWHAASPTDPVGQLSPSIQVTFQTADALGRERLLRTSVRLRR
jgi:hypothetical protein